MERVGYKLTDWCEDLSIPLEQKVKVAIHCALLIYQDYDFKQWANDWLEDRDREIEKAWPPPENYFQETWHIKWPENWALRKVETVALMAWSASRKMKHGRFLADSVARAIEAASWRLSRETILEIIYSVIENETIFITEGLNNARSVEA